MKRQITINSTRTVTVTAEPTRRPLHLGFDPEYRLVYAGWGWPPKGMIGRAGYLIGAPAELLYEAITGHLFEEPAEAAEVERALAARGEVFAHREINPVMAMRVLGYYENHLQPGLGQTRLDARRRPRLGAAEIIMLPELAL
jgi:hypothetical protein